MDRQTALRRDSARFSVLYEFEPNFRMRIFSENHSLFAPREGDADRFQIFPKRANVFFLKSMPAELKLLKSAATKQYEMLILHQNGKNIKAKRITSQPRELYDTVAELDARMYRAHNNRELLALAAFFTSDLEFYHDQTGKTNYRENLSRFKENFAKPTAMRRELVPGRLEVYPVAELGAIEIGTHHFYQTDPEHAEKRVAQPRFVHVWRRSPSGWPIMRVVSYAH